MKSWTSSLIPYLPYGKTRRLNNDFNYTDANVKEMTDFFETRVENLEPKENNRKSSAAAKKGKRNKTSRNRKEQTLTPVKNLL